MAEIPCHALWEPELRETECLTFKWWQMLFNIFTTSGRLRNDLAALFAYLLIFHSRLTWQDANDDPKKPNIRTLSEILLVSLNNRIDPISLEDIGIYNHICEHNRRLSLARIIADTVMTTRSFVPSTTGGVQLHGIIVHLIMHCATDDVPGNRGRTVAMGGSCAIWRKCNTHADNGLSGAIGEFVLIFQGDLGQRAAEICQC